jgi:hypothetical protein
MYKEPFGSAVSAKTSSSLEGYTSANCIFSEDDCSS